MALSSCCCCFSLRTGTLILAVLGAISSVSMFIAGVQGADAIRITQGIGLVAYLLCIYAVIKKKAVWMKPSLIWSIVSSILSIIAAILMILAYGALKATPIDEMTPEEKEHFEYLEKAVVVLSIIHISVAVLSLYFFAVMYSFYKELKKE